MRYRRDANEARASVDNLELSEFKTTLKVKWGCGFGPKPMFDYETGVSLIDYMKDIAPMDRKWLMTCECGGIREGSLRGGLTIEEPDIDPSELKRAKFTTSNSVTGLPPAPGEASHYAQYRQAKMTYPPGQQQPPPSPSNGSSLPARPPRHGELYHNGAERQGSDRDYSRTVSHPSGSARRPTNDQEGEGRKSPPRPQLSTDGSGRMYYPEDMYGNVTEDSIMNYSVSIDPRTNHPIDAEANNSNNNTNVVDPRMR
jgi:hypothetical protein